MGDYVPHKDPLIIREVGRALGINQSVVDI